MNIEKIENQIVNASMKRYRRWRKRNGDVLPFGSHGALKDRDEWEIAKACERLYNAKRKSSR